jgi:Transposase zinc-binding domain
MARPPGHSPGVADIFRAHGAAWRKANAGHASLGRLKVMSAIETCRTAALGGHVERGEDCAHECVAYNSCLMGRSSNGELACRDRRFFCELQRSFSP